MNPRITITYLPQIKRSFANDVLHAIACAAIDLQPKTINIGAGSGCASFAVDPSTVTDEKLLNISKRLGTLVEYDGKTFANFEA